MKANHYFFLFFFIHIINFAKPEKTLEIDFYKNARINESDYSELISNQIFSILRLGSQ